jgi:hypothetical protein
VQFTKNRAERDLRMSKVKQKEALAAGGAGLTLVPVSVGTPATGSVVVLHSPGGWRIELPVGTACWLAEFVRQLP